jgi:hypothetical protein
VSGVEIRQSLPLSSYSAPERDEPTGAHDAPF